MSARRHAKQNWYFNKTHFPPISVNISVNLVDAVSLVLSMRRLSIPSWRHCLKTSTTIQPPSRTLAHMRSSMPKSCLSPSLVRLLWTVRVCMQSSKASCFSVRTNSTRPTFASFSTHTHTHISHKTYCECVRTRFENFVFHLTFDNVRSASAADGFFLPPYQLSIKASVVEFRSWCVAD